MEPPEGRSEVLEQYREASASRWRTAVLVVLIVYGVPAVAGQDALWFTRSWGAAAIIVGIVVLAIIYVTNKSTHSVAAGSDWLKISGDWVDTYDLNRIKASPGSNALYVSFRDNGGRKLTIDMALLQENQKLWNLVYNGMAHSVAYGNAELKGLNYDRYLNLDRFRSMEAGQDGDGESG